MYYAVMAWLPALIGAAPLLLKRRIGAAITLFIVGGIILQVIAWLAQPSTAYPLFGFVGFMAIIVWLVAAIVDGIAGEGPSYIAWFPVGGFVVFIGTGVAGWSLFNANSYASIIGPMESREWTQDIQPKDPRHMAMVTPENALYLARKALGQEGAIGSQFNIDSDTMTLQRVHDELVYVLPLDYTSFSVWTSAGAVPAYVVVYAEDPERKPLMVKLSADRGLNYTPGAYFSYYLERHLRQLGYIDMAFADSRFMLDGNGQAWWITTTYKPTIMWSGEKATGVLITNPTDGSTTWYTLKDVPKWVERVIPRDFVRDYVSWWGDLSGGWWNSFWAGKNLTKPEEGGTVIIYGSDNRPMWVTDVTSESTKDDSLVGLIYTDTQTGKSTYYAVAGGGTVRAVLAAVNKNQDVQYRHLHGDYVQVYNIDGTMGAVVPLLNQNDAFQGVAIVELKNPQDVAVGTTQFEALNRYKAILARRGQQIAVEANANAQTLHGVIDRINQDVSGSGGGLYYFIVTGAPHIFTASSQDYPKLPLAEKGDNVEVKYLASGESVLPVTGFDDLSIVIEHTQAEQQVQGAAIAHQQTEVKRDTAIDLTKQFQNLTSEQQRELLKGAKQ